MQKIKVKDEVVVITGKDKGKRGEVTKLLGDRVVVSGINLVKEKVPDSDIKTEILQFFSNVCFNDFTCFGTFGDSVAFRFCFLFHQYPFQYNICVLIKLYQCVHRILTVNLQQKKPTKNV